MTTTARRLLLKQAGGAAPFSPSDLSNLYPWFKADAITGLVDADPVATWEDSSVLNKDATQATAGKRPLYKTAVQNGLPGVLLDGSDDGMATAAFAAAMTQPITVFVVAKASANDATQRHAIDGVSSTQRNVILDGGSGTPNWRYYAGSLVNGGARDTNANIFSALFSGASSKLRKNGVEVAAGNPGSQALTGLALGASNLGAGGAGNYWKGHLFEIILYNANHSGSFATVEAYLGSKWGITV